MTTNDTINLLGYIFISIIIILGVFVIYALYKTFQIEKRREEFSPNMKKGDKIHIPVGSVDIKGEILEINQDRVKIITEFDKSRVYPNE